MINAALLRHGRLLALALSSTVVVGACATWSPRLAMLAGEPLSEGSLTAAATPAPPPPSRPAPRKGERSSDAEPERPPAVEVVRLKPRPAPGPFAMDLYREGDFVHQATKEWCVAGSTQTMMNIMETGKPRLAASVQERLYERGRKLSPNQAKLGPIGVDLTGWAELLNRGGYGPYVVDGSDTLRGAIRKAARAVRMTGRPVGLVTWRGAHSWVMSGFTATADPAYTNDFRVRGVYIEDTWYPWVSTIWGASRPPGTLVPVRRLQEDYLPYRRPLARYPKRDGRYMLVLPVLPEGTVAR